MLPQFIYFFMIAYQEDIHLCSININTRDTSSLNGDF